MSNETKRYLLSRSSSWAGNSVVKPLLIDTTSPPRSREKPHGVISDGSWSCPKPARSSRVRLRDRPATSYVNRSSPFFSLCKVGPDENFASSDQSFKPIRTFPCSAAAKTQLLRKEEFQRNIKIRSNYWQKYRVSMTRSTHDDFLALTYKDRKKWNEKHNVGVCSTHLTKSEYEVFWKWFTVRLQENFPTNKLYAYEVDADLSALAEDFVKHGVFPDKKGAESLLERVNIDKNGKVSYREFVASMTADNFHLEETAHLRKFIYSLKSNMRKKKREEIKNLVTKKLHKMIQERKMAAQLKISYK